MEDFEFSNERLVDLTQWLKVVGEPHRLLLLNQIIAGVQCNCELGNALQMAPNLISHHLSILREAGLVEIRRDPLDARWVYYSINMKAMEELREVFNAFFNPLRAQPRSIACGPQNSNSTLFEIKDLEKND